jgi:hypothetical protein
MRVLKMTAAMAVVGTVMGAGFAAVAAGATKGGAVKLFGTPRGAVGSIMFAGAIGDYGSTQRMTQSGVPNPNGNFVKLSLKRGSFVGNATALFAKLNNARPSLNRSTCSGALSGTGPVVLGGGSGLYTGIGGTLKVTATFAFVGPRFKSGKHKGQCNVNANPLAQFSLVSGGGTVSFS